VTSVSTTMFRSAENCESIADCTMKLTRLIVGSPSGVETCTMSPLRTMPLVAFCGILIIVVRLVDHSVWLPASNAEGLAFLTRQDVTRTGMTLPDS